DSAKYSVRGRGGIVRASLFIMGWPICAQGHAEGHHRQAQRGGPEHVGRSNHTSNPRQPGVRNPAARAADAAGAGCLSEGRDREMVADHQGGEHQGGMSRFVACISRSDAVKLPRRNFLHLAAGAVALPTLPRIARAQAYPSRPVRLIVPLAPAGASDITARLIGQWLSERLGQQFVIDNRPGGGGNIGTEAVVRAPADGYTLLLVGGFNAVNATFYDKLNYNFIRDIAPVASIIRTPFAMTVNPTVPAKPVS